jgi:hypothetical protein
MAVVLKTATSRSSGKTSLPFQRQQRLLANRQGRDPNCVIN